VVVAGQTRDRHKEADMAGFNGIAWFEVGTDDPAGAQKFYGEVFGWTFGHDNGDAPGFQMVTAGDGPGLHAGGLFDTAGTLPGYAVFGVLVENVAETCQQVQAAGGSIRRAPQVTPAGITFAHLLDPAGNQFEVFTMPPGGE
jgi:predicted enzyme related to lactoylglutathione lyase